MGKEKIQSRIHMKSSKAINDFMDRNKKTFAVEKTATGFPTYEFKKKAFYIRDKRMNPGSLNKISLFQNQVAASELYGLISIDKTEDIRVQTKSIERTLMYKGFFFDPLAEREIKNAIKIDLNTAYWQTCRIIPIIDKQLYRYIIDNCTKPTRLKLTGTLGMKMMRTEVVEGKKKPTFLKNTTKRRYIFQNIYARTRKFVDELMVWAWMRDPRNFIGFYVDCIWLREPDFELIEKIKEMFDIKISYDNLTMKVNSHRKFIMLDDNISDDELTEYDVSFKNNEFINYKFFHNFTQDLQKIDFLKK